MAVETTRILQQGESTDCIYNILSLFYTVLAHECPEDLYLNRHVIKQVTAACAFQPDVWRDLGIELLQQDAVTQLDVIKVNNVNDITKCCSEMLTLWRQQQPGASWSQLIEALRQVKLNTIATDIEKLLMSPAEQEDEVPELQCLKITSPQQQVQQTEVQKYSHEKSSKGTIIIMLHITFLSREHETYPLGTIGSLPLINRLYTNESHHAYIVSHGQTWCLSVRNYKSVHCEMIWCFICYYTCS